MRWRSISSGRPRREGGSSGEVSSAGVGFGISTALGLATAVLLLRHLGVNDFGRYATVMAILGIVAGITDAGLTAVGSREISVARTAVERAEILNNLLLLRVIGASLGVLAAVGFTVVAGYEGVVIAGTAIGGVGVVLISAQSMLTVPIWVGLRIVSLTALEVLRNLLTLAGVAVLVLAGAGLLPLFGLQVAVAVVLIPVTIVLARVGVRFARGVRRTVIVQLVRETLPLAVAFAMSVDLLPRARRARLAALDGGADRPLRHVVPHLRDAARPAGVDPLGRAAAAVGRR